MKLTDNVHILKWVDEMAALTKPDEIVWIDGSEEQLEKLRHEAMGTGELIKLNEEKLPAAICTAPTSTTLRVLKAAHLSAPSVRRTRARPTTGWIRRKCTRSCTRYTTAP